MLEYSNILKNKKPNLNLKEIIFSIFIKLISFLCIMVLAFIIFFIVKESIPILKHTGIYDFVFGKVLNKKDSIIFKFTIEVIYGTLK